MKEHRELLVSASYGESFTGSTVPPLKHSQKHKTVHSSSDTLVTIISLLCVTNARLPARLEK